jgi:hypothetical protein
LKAAAAAMGSASPLQIGVYLLTTNQAERKVASYIRPTVIEESLPPELCVTDEEVACRQAIRFNSPHRPRIRCEAAWSTASNS